MERGPWHQMGDRSQKMVVEQLAHQSGVGVVVSPRDLAMHKASEYAAEYHDAAASVLFDPQFHIPNFTNKKFESYPTNDFRTSVSNLNQISDEDLEVLAGALQEENDELETNGIIAPAVVYEAARPDIVNLNQRLFQAARAVGQASGKPTYATVFLGTSVTASQVTIQSVLSNATSLDCDGWYFAFEFPPERIPSQQGDIYRCLSCGLALAGTGLPVLHAYAGPLGLLSHGFGATGVAVGHSQNLWRFSRERWETPTGSGGGGDAPPRFFSSVLWGTIIFPDETQQLSEDLRQRILTHSPFSDPLIPGGWSRWDANKHLIWMLCSSIGAISSVENARTAAQSAITTLENAVDLHEQIEEELIDLRDDTSAYQENWKVATEQLLSNHDDDFDYLEMFE